MDIIGKWKIWFAISGITIVLGILAMFIWKLPLSIDFKGGTLLELSFEQKEQLTTEEIRQATADLDFLKNAQIQKTGNKSVLIRSLPLDKEQEQQLFSILNEKVGESKEIRLETVGPIISNSLKQKAILAVILASLAIVLYIAWAFRSVPKPANPWHFGIAAILALIHDLFVTFGVFAILSHFLGYEVDSLFITAILTMMGFSVHDTIVVFDRIRENLKKHPSLDFPTNVNNSIIQTLTRSLSTSLTVVIVLTCLLVLGGKSIQSFVAILLVGIVTGTYSSIFNASPILVLWQKRRT